MEDRLNEANKIVKDMQESLDLSKIEELIKDNKISFEHEDKKYRVRLLSHKEKEELDNLRRKKFGQLIKDKDILLEKDLIKVYKEREIDVESINEEIKKTNSEILDLQIKLGESISKNESETILKNYREQIETLIIKKNVYITQKNLFLEFSMENQLLNYVAQIITYLSTDILEDGVWRRMWLTLEDFQNSKEEEVINKAAQYSMLLQYL